MTKTTYAYDLLNGSQKMLLLLWMLLLVLIPLHIDLFIKLILSIYCLVVIVFKWKDFGELLCFGIALVSVLALWIPRFTDLFLCFALLGIILLVPVAVKNRTWKNARLLVVGIMSLGFAGIYLAFSF